MNDPTSTAMAGITLSDVSRARALDLLDEQRRRILELSDAVVDGQRQLQRSITSLSWRSPSRFEFDVRVSDLLGGFARSAGSLRAALAECDRARDLLRADTTVERRGGGWEKEFSGRPADRR